MANSGSDTVTAFVIGRDAGTLTSLGPPVPAGRNPVGLAVTPSGNFLLVTSWGSKDVSVLAIEPGTRALASEPASVVSAGEFPFGVVVTPSGRHAYVADMVESGTVEAFSVDETRGELVPIPGSPFPAGRGTRHLAVAPDAASSTP